MRHSKRTILTADDVDSALSLRNVEPIYGFASGDPLRFKRAVGHKDLFYIDDRDVEFKDVIEAPLPKAPLDTAVTVHWLAIEGVQPAIPENAPVEALVAPSENKKFEQGKEDGLPVEIKLPVKHVLSRELQLYFDKITELIVSKSDSDLFKKALISLATDSGLHPLVPYFTFFIADEVTRSLNDFPLLYALMRVVRSLLQNKHIHIEPYLHQLMPSVITCLVAKRLGNRLCDNHWELRDFTANLVTLICKRFGHAYHNLQPRVTRTLLHAFLDPMKALTQHYGAIQGLAALGPSVVRLLILPNLEPYMKPLEPEMLLESQKNEIKRREAWRVYDALLHAAGLCLYERLKLFPNLLSPPARSVWHNNVRVVTTRPDKRKASNDLLSQQPPLKKVATDGSLGSISIVGDLQQGPPVAGDAFRAISGESEIGQSSSSGQISNSNESYSGGNRREKAGRRGSNMSAVLMQAWKEDVDAGHLLASLYELFGEGIFSFTPSPEMSFFL
ncbi:transcription initiation factor TFIID subunit 6-like isoform X2 [Aristolochia californica]